MIRSLSPLLGQKFAYAHGRIGVLQQRLLSQGDIDRLLGAQDIRDCERILTELPLTAEIDQSISDSDAILSALGAGLREEVRGMCPVSLLPTFSILWVEQDAPLIAYLLKKNRGLTSAISQEPQVSMSAYDPEELRALVEEGIQGTLPDHLVELVKSIPSEEITPEEIDQAVGKHFALLQLRLAKASGSAHITAFVRHLIDTRNISMRCRIADSEAKEVESKLFEGGTLSTSHLSKKPLSSVVESSDLTYTLSGLKEDTEPTELERKMSHVLQIDTLKMWNVPLSIEPLFAYAAITKSQLKLLRALLIGKRNGLSPQEIKKLLPPFISTTHY